MGKKGREIVELDIKQMIADLNRVYADEWLAHFYFLHAAHMVSGINSEEIAEVFRQAAADELGHAAKIADRIIQLGGVPVAKIEDLAEASHMRKVNFPRETSDLKGFIKVFLEAERIAIDSYSELLKKTHQKDIVTHELIEHILEDEVADEEEFENLLG